MMSKTVCLTFLALALTMTACTSVTVPSLQPGGNSTPTASSGPSKTIFFPRQEKTEGERAVMDGLDHGTLVLVDNCIRLERDKSLASYLLIWPPDFKISIENDTINILDGDGEIVAHVGDTVQISGGEFLYYRC
jgi:hypothetical protein